jgi:hypothetical protein
MGNVEFAENQRQEVCPEGGPLIIVTETNLFAAFCAIGAMLGWGGMRHTRSGQTSTFPMGHSYLLMEKLDRGTGKNRRGGALSEVMSIIQGYLYHFVKDFPELN